MRIGNLLMAAITILIAACVYGAFIGSRQATEMFSSPIFSLFWVFLAVLLVFEAFKILRSRGVMCSFIYIGIAVTLTGFILSSENAHNIAVEIFNSDKAYHGYMKIKEGESSNIIRDRQGQAIKTLPFAIKLNDFEIKYYDKDTKSADEGGAMIKEYISDITVIRQDEHALKQKIKVNKPLHFAGYHFYQHSYDTENARFTILEASSDTASPIILAGFAVVLFASFYQMWLKPLNERLGK